jgi:hypothetical protein
MSRDARLKVQIAAPPVTYSIKSIPAIFLAETLGTARALRSAAAPPRALSFPDPGNGGLVWSRRISLRLVASLPKGHLAALGLFLLLGQAQNVCFWPS